MSHESLGYWSNYIDGRWCDAIDGQRITVDDPATGKSIAEVARGREGDIHAAVLAARRAFDARTLVDMKPSDRGQILHRVADELSADAVNVARIVCLDTGKALSVAREEVQTAIRYLRYYAGLAETIEGKSIPRGTGFANFTVRSPYGVSAQVVPWNFPLELTARSLACAIATGNTVVIKSPELAPLSGMVIAKACASADVPAGCVNIVSGYGHDAGTSLVSHAGIDHIVFTGSLQTGRSVLRQAAERIIPCIMELGGKSAAIVYEDADMDDVMKAVVAGAFMNSGQNCNALTRIIVHRTRRDELIGRLEHLVSTMTIGAGIDDCDITPLISRQQLTNVSSMCEQATASGLRSIHGGEVLAECAGYFMSPTVFVDVPIHASIAQNEVFGPVVCVTEFSTPAEAVSIANGTNFGLASGVFSKDVNLALWTADQLWSGQVYVNGWFVGGVETPFGGVKQSGYGREKGREALDGYLQTRNIGIKIGLPR
jgi:aldehyde dehydrogenase (NAD+)